MSIKDLAQQMSAQGRGPDDVLVHMSSKELASMQGLAKAAGGTLTLNPKTGLPEAGFLDSLLPTILGVGATMIGGPLAGAAVGALTGGIQAKANDQDVLMGAVTGGMGGYGGGQLAAGLTGAGSTAAQQLAQQGVADQTASLMQGSLAGIGGVDPGFVNAMRPDMLYDATAAAKNTFAAQPFYQQVGQGAQTLTQPGGIGQFVEGMGGPMKTMQATGMAAAPLMSGSFGSKKSSGAGIERDEDRKLPEYDYVAQQTHDYYQPGQGTHERMHFTNPTFSRRMAEGGIASFARGGAVGLNSGDFIVPADVVAMAGGGSTDAGMAALSRAIGAEPIKGPGDGLSDDIPAHIDGQQPALVANGEMVVRQPKNIKKLYTMLDRIRQQATGSKEQVRPVDLDKALA